MHEILLGALAMASFIAGLFFLRFWKNTNDRFFLLFALAFWIEAINRVFLGLVQLSEYFPIIYLMRLSAFGLILIAIFERNQQQNKNL